MKTLVTEWIEIQTKIIALNEPRDKTNIFSRKGQIQWMGRVNGKWELGTRKNIFDS